MLSVQLSKYGTPPMHYTVLYNVRVLFIIKYYKKYCVTCYNHTPRKDNMFFLFKSILQENQQLWRSFLKCTLSTLLYLPTQVR
jgi:hypothetical protein